MGIRSIIKVTLPTSAKAALAKAMISHKTDEENASTIMHQTLLQKLEAKGWVLVERYYLHGADDFGDYAIFKHRIYGEVKVSNPFMPNEASPCNTTYAVRVAYKKDLRAALSEQANTAIDYI